MTVAGCAPGADAELRAVIEEASLPGVDSWSCQWGSSDFDHEPKAWYGCWGEVPWTLKRASRTVKARLLAHGYRVSNDRSARAVYFTAVRGDHTLCVDVLGRGFTVARNTPAALVVAPGTVFIDAWTVDARRPEQRCAALPAIPEV